MQRKVEIKEVEKAVEKQVKENVISLKVQIKWGSE